MNQGLQAASGDLILQLQDDWDCQGPSDYLRRAVAAIDTVPEVGMVILKRHPNPLPVKQFIACNQERLRIFDNRPKVEIVTVGEHAYTDWPHLKRRSLHHRLGHYAEGVPMWEMELDFSRRFNAQIDVFVADIEGLDAFEHIGEAYSYNWPWKKRVTHIASKFWASRALMNGSRSLSRRIRGQNFRN